MMKNFIVVTCIVCAVINFSNCSDIDNDSTRNSRFIAALVSFPNEQCTINNDIGVCFSTKKCTRMGGRSLGTCAHGYGTCCKFTAQCTTSDSVTVTRNQTTLINPPMFPSTCTFNFPRQPGVCQIRLDFTRFNLQQPTAQTANCDVDSMTISGTVTTDSLTLCGALDTNEHMYLDYGSTNGPIQVAITTNGNSMMGSNNMYGYDIRTTQIKCNSERRVPADCLQYFRNQTGVVKSFNFPTQQLNNEDYRICVEKRNPGDQIQWKTCDSLMPMMPSIPDPTNFCIVGSCGNPVLGGTCGTDYLEIPKSSQGRYCQAPFPRSITTDDFWIRVNFDQVEPSGDSPVISFPVPPTGVCTGNTFITPPGYYGFTVMGDNCVATPKNSVPDIANTGFCLTYAVVGSSVPEGDDPPPMAPVPGPPAG